MASNARSSSGRPTQAKSRGASSGKSASAAKRSSSSAKSRSPKASSAAKARPRSRAASSANRSRTARSSTPRSRSSSSSNGSSANGAVSAVTDTIGSAAQKATTPIIAGGAAAAGLIGGMVLGKRVLGPRRTVLRHPRLAQGAEPAAGGQGGPEGRTADRPPDRRAGPGSQAGQEGRQRAVLRPWRRRSSTRGPTTALPPRRNACRGRRSPAARPPPGWRRERRSAPSCAPSADRG